VLFRVFIIVCWFVLLLDLLVDRHRSILDEILSKNVRTAYVKKDAQRNTFIKIGICLKYRFNMQQREQQL